MPVHPHLGLPLIFTHIGTVTLGQRIEFLLDVIKNLDEAGLISPEIIKFNFIGIKYDEEQTERIKRYSKGIEQYFTYSARYDREDTLRISSESDFLLNFTQENFPIINAKTYDYFSVKRPILVIPDDNSILSEIVQNNKAGYVFKSPAKLRQFILRPDKHKEGRYEDT